MMYSTFRSGGIVKSLLGQAAFSHFTHSRALHTKLASTEIKALKDSIIPRPPFCSGTIPLSPQNAVVFYKQGAKSNRVDFSQLTDDDLMSLAEACDPATFGVDQHDILDETYRKAGKIDNADFASTFDLGQARLVDIIRAQLLLDSKEPKSINAELYKLNVYGKDSFFKTHKDTPRSEAMFGSLVVVYPTCHEGGALILRHGGKEWALDSAKAIRTHDGPAIAYTAFYSDIEHEVTAVTSGFRVTLTYNLFFSDGDTLPALDTPTMPEFEGALAAALNSPNFLPDGGLLAFGLAFMYPISPGKTVLNNILDRLKGSDETIRRVCANLSLDISLKAVYLDPDGPHPTMVDHVPNLEDMGQVDDSVTCLLREDFGGRVIYDIEKEVPMYENGEPVTNALEVLWITPLTDQTLRLKSPYVAYGNDACIGYAYGDVCLIVQVGPPGRRATKPT